MIIRSKAPLRLGLAGGGTDVSPYADLYGGSILNATINMYAHCTIIPTDSKTIKMTALDIGVSEEIAASEIIDTSGPLALIKGVHNRVCKDFNPGMISYEISTYVEAPPGSGLGSSSTLVVSILGAFVEWLKLPLGEYDIARLAYDIERVDLGLAGGRQDQYAATFGGFNFMEFYKDDKVIVNPLRVKQRMAAELEHNLVLFYTGTSRESAEIIKQQTSNIQSNQDSALEATHNLKAQSVKMKEALLTDNIDSVGSILNFGWKFKKQMAHGISNPVIDKLYDTALANGATGGKISGAGGGGFFFFYCPVNQKHNVITSLEKLGVKHRNYLFTKTGLYSYTLNQ